MAAPSSSLEVSHGLSTAPSTVQACVGLVAEKEKKRRSNAGGNILHFLRLLTREKEGNISETILGPIQSTMNDYDPNESSGSESEAYDSFDDESCKEESRENLVSDSPKALQIVVKRVGNGEGDFLTLEVDPGASVLDLKNLISAELTAKNEREPVDRQRLVYFGRMLRDNNELLLSKEIKMQAESINYVHLSPLPEGAKPSKRSNASPVSGEQDATESLESRLERARRLGAAARERRRRRRAAPYESARRRRGVDRSNDGEEAQTYASQPQEEPGLFAFTTASDPVHQLSSSQLFTLPVRHATPPVFAPLQSSFP